MNWTALALGFIGGALVSLATPGLLRTLALVMGIILIARAIAMTT